MIGSLRGSVIYRDKEKIEIDIQGVGYEVYLPKGELSKTKVGDDVELFVYDHMVEESNTLFGFLERKSKQVFEMLISVSGIGPKSALGILSLGTGKRVLKAIAEADVEFFKQVKGIGSKGAQRIIVDLKSKVGSVKDLDLQTETGGNEAVYQALSSLGFRREEIRKALTDLPENIKSEDEKIKFALKQLA